MKTIKLTGYVHVNKYNTSEFIVTNNDMTKYGDVLVGTVDIDFTIPAEFSATAAEVSLLEARVEQLSEEYHRNVAALKSRISDLQCLPAPEATA